jgi:hypothetical protein
LSQNYDREALTRIECFFRLLSFSVFYNNVSVTLYFLIRIVNIVRDRAKERASERESERKRERGESIYVYIHTHSHTHTYQHKHTHRHTQMTSPKTTCLPSSHGVATVVMKNCDPLVSLPALAIDNCPGFVCLNLKFSSANCSKATDKTLLYWGQPRRKQATKHKVCLNTFHHTPT